MNKILTEVLINGVYNDTIITKSGSTVLDKTRKHIYIDKETEICKHKGRVDNIKIFLDNGNDNITVLYVNADSIKALNTKIVEIEKLEFECEFDELPF